MKKIGCILLCSLVINGCGTPGEITRNTITEKYDFVTESSLPYEEDTQLYSDTRDTDSEKKSQESSKGEKREFTDEEMEKLAEIRKRFNVAGRHPGFDRK